MVFVWPQTSFLWAYKYKRVATFYWRCMLLAARRQQQEFQQIEKSLEYNQAVAYDREESIVGIEQEIAMVQDIFKDLATLVEEQGLVIGECTRSMFACFKQDCVFGEEPRSRALCSVSGS